MTSGDWTILGGVAGPIFASPSAALWKSSSFTQVLAAGDHTSGVGAPSDDSSQPRLSAVSASPDATR